MLTLEEMQGFSRAGRKRTRSMLSLRPPGSLWLIIGFCIVCGVSGGPASAEAAPARTVCQKRTEPRSPGEQAFAQGDLARAESQLRDESKAAGTGGERARNALVRVLLREGKLNGAANEAQEWLTAAPNDVWAQTATDEVDLRSGLVNEAIAHINAALTIDGCNPQVHADLAHLQRLSGLNASARAQLNFAHNLDPIDAQIGSSWLSLQPRSVRLENLTALLAQASLPAAERQRFEQNKARLSAPPSAGHCRLLSGTAPASIPFHRIQDGPLSPIYDGLEVYFNGKERRLEIDTGASGLTLSRAAASALHLDADQTGKTFGIGDEGAASSHLSTVKSIKIGGLEFADCDVDVLDTDAKVLTAQDGLIGGDVFAEFVVTLDFPGHMLTLAPLPPLPNETGNASAPSLNTDPLTSDAEPHDRYVDASMKDWTKVFRSGHDLILPIRLNGGPIRLFMVDTGAEMDSISPEVAREVGKVSKGSWTDIQGLSGKVKNTYTTGPLTLDFAGLRYPSPGMVGFDDENMSRGAGIEIAGFLGFETLRSLTVQIDYRDNLMHFTYDPKRIQRCVAGIRVGDCLNGY